MEKVMVLINEFKVTKIVQENYTYALKRGNIYWIDCLQSNVVINNLEESVHEM